MYVCLLYLTQQGVTLWQAKDILYIISLRGG